MSPPPYLILRDFRVWFPKRRGFLEALRRGEPDYVRAVDGIDMDIHKGEVFCLVGESGCGKTTTGKGILRLVEPTGGDVFVDPPPEVPGRYEAAKAAGDAEALEAIRRRWSLSYKEHRTWSRRDMLLFVLAGLSAGILAAVGIGLLVAILAGPTAPPLVILGSGAAGGVVGAVGTLPPVKPRGDVPRLLMAFAAGAAIVGDVLGLTLAEALAGIPVGAGTFLTAAIRLDPFLLVLQIAAGAAGANLAAKRSIRYWQARVGIEADKLRKLRKTLQIVFQDPYESLNPKHSVFDIVAEPLLVNRITRSRPETEARVRQALDDAGLRPPEDFLYRYPHELSGGQRQRVVIAGALVLEPDFLVADEPVSMLDVSIRTEILELLLELRERKGLTYLFITHDLSLAWVLADRIGVMYLGKLVEHGPKQEVIRNPRHPYTKALLSVVPVPDPDRRRERIILRGERPDPANIPPGCRFHPRCPAAFERCGWIASEVLEELREIARADGSAGFLDAAAPDGPLEIAIPGAAGVEDWLRGTVAARAEERRALKAVRSVANSGGTLRVALHPFQEPELMTVGRNTQVSCHLFTEPVDAPPAP